MAKKYSGEISLTAENRRISLRLENGDTQELEDYFDLPILEILLKKFNERAPTSDELLVVYAAMTGRNINEGTELIEACKEMNDEVGVAAALVGVKKCLWASAVSMAKTKQGQNLGQKLGKPHAVQTQHPLSRPRIKRATNNSMSWTQSLLKRQALLKRANMEQKV